MQQSISVNKNQLKNLEKNVKRGDLAKTNVALIKEQVQLILNMRHVSGSNPPTSIQLQIIDAGTHYLRESFPSLYRAALEDRNLSSFKSQLDAMLNLIEKTQNNEIQYSEMTKIVGQTVFDTYVKPDIKS